MFPVNIFSGLAALYIIIRAIFPMPSGWAIKIPLIILVIAAAMKFQIIHLIGGPQFFAPKVPGFVTAVSGVLYISVYILFFLLLIKDLIYLPCFLFGARFPMNGINALLTVISLTIGLLGLYNALKAPYVKEYKVSIPNLPKEAKGLRAAVIADIHADRITKKKTVKKIVDLAMAAKPDLILIPGDFADGEVEEVGKELEPLKELKAPLGVFAVSGNHEYYNGWEDWKPYLESLGLPILENENKEIVKGLFIAGVPDTAANHFGGTKPDIDKALEGAEDKCVILLGHKPNYRPEAKERGVALLVSGHTHGGMVWGLHKIVERFNCGAVSGLYYHEDGTAVFVTNGASLWNGFPTRLGIPAEIPILVLEN
ncbi:metallophosphoesterase [bacterium]|nr:metallophosphoesterase [bacterium]